MFSLSSARLTFLDDMLFEICVNLFEQNSIKDTEFEDMDDIIENISALYSQYKHKEIGMLLEIMINDDYSHLMHFFLFFLTMIDVENIRKVFDYWRTKGGSVKPFIPVLEDPIKQRAKKTPAKRRNRGKQGSGMFFSWVRSIFVPFFNSIRKT